MSGGSGFISPDKSATAGGDFDVGISAPINFGNYYGGAATTGQSEPPVIAAAVSSPLMIIPAIGLLAFALYKKTGSK